MKTGDNIDSGNFNEFESNGFQKGVGSAKGWLDLHLPLIVRTIAGAPPRTAFIGGIFGYSWAVNNNLDVAGGVEQDHIFEENNLTDGRLHIHFYNGSLDSTDRYVKFKLEYTHDNPFAIAASITITSLDLLIPAKTPVGTHFLYDMGVFPTKNIGSSITGLLTRIASTGTAPSGNPFVAALHAHLRVDTPFGSRGITTK